MSNSKWGHSHMDTGQDGNNKFDEILKKGRPILPPMSPQTIQKKEPPQTSTSIKYISNALPIEVTPPEIIINDIEPNQTYEVVVLVRNLTNIGRRIRVYQPKTNKFRCDYDMQGNIAAGLAMKLVLSFETDKAGDFHDVLEIVSDEKFTVTVPLHAYQPQASVVFDPFVNFGFIKINKEETRPVLFENQGKKDGKVELKFDGVNEMAILPSSFVLKEGEKKEVLIRYTPKEAGIFRGTIEVTVEGQSLLKHIDVSATSVDYFIFMVDKSGAQTQTFDFGDIYFGQFREIEGYLVNNSPQRFNFKAKFLTGMQNSAGDIFSIQTPFDLGQEQIQRIMTCSPAEGIIDSYSQVPIKFSCKSRVTDHMIFWTRNYCMKKEKHDADKTGEYAVEQRFEPTNYSYTCIFEFDGKSDMSPYIHLSAKGICPTVKISHHLINFGDCKVHDRRDYLVTLENKNEEHPVDFSFSNVAHFKVTPKKSKALPQTSQAVTFTFEPKSLGKFSSAVDLELFGIYKIPIKLMGTALSQSAKKFSKRGPESLPEDFNPERKFVTDDNIDYGQKRIKKENRLIFMSIESGNTSNQLAPLGEATNISENLEIYNSIKSNKEKYNAYIETQKHKRKNAPKELEKNRKVELTGDKLEDLLPNKEFWITRDKEEKQILHPFDFDFIFGTETIPLDKPKYALPDPHDPLFVTKPIGRYEPDSGGKVDTFKPDPTKPYKKIFNAEAQSQAELRDIQRELTPEELQKVFVGPTTIDFGSVYVKSKAVRYFAVKNQLKTAIVVQIICNNNELAESYQRPQVIPPMQTAGFEVIFFSQNLQSFKGAVKYLINNKHEFAFAACAQVEPVKLVLDTNNLVFKFLDKDEDMELTSTITIINKGNAPGNFKWDVSQNSVFKVSPMREIVPAEATLKVSITYVPSGNNFRGESERLAMHVENGETQYLTCVGHVTEAKIEFREVAVDFGNVLVSQEQPKAVRLKNKHKGNAVYKVNPILPPGITVHPMGGRIPGDSDIELRVAVCSNEERQINDDIVVNVRGGKQVKLPIKARVIIPQIRIVEDDFDFGGVTYGSTAILEMTIVNESGISAILNLDLSNSEDNPGIQFLEVQPASEPGEDESSFIVSVNQENLPQDPNDDREASLSMSESEEESVEKEHMRNFNIKIKENSTLNFILKFTPNEAKNYGFELPIKLQGYGKIDTLTRYISCRGLRPRCVIDPPTVEFKKKTITSFDKPAPDQERVILSNMDHSKTITWKLDTTSLDEDRIYTIYPSSGKIEPGQQQVLIVGFSPMNPGQYDKSVPLYIDNDTSKAYGHLNLKGFGDFPRLLFDRREIILPVVPLDVQSRCTFRIVNDGYENLTLKYDIANNVGNINKDIFDLEFPEGKQLGVTKPKLKVDAVFKSKKPFSFTVELNFVDDNKHVYRIRVSATADNSLFTNFPYLQRNFGEYEIVAPENKPIYLKELDNDNSDTSPKAFSIGVSKSGSVTSRAGRSLLGYSPIPQRELEKSCENMKTWLNQNVLSSYISKFPNDIIDSNGSQLFELIQYLTGKMPAGKANLNLITKKTEKVKMLHKQYDDILQTLKENGCLLNTIRPEYLLRHTDYNTYVKLQDNQYLTPNMVRLSEGKFLYLSVDAWLTLVYQILKVYYLGRVTLKNFRGTLGMPPDKLNVPDYYLEGSNVISVGENLLLRWLEVHYDKQRPGLSKRIKNFGDDLKDGHVFAAVIQSYVGNNASKALNVMRNNPQNRDDYLFNAGKVITALEELGLQTPFAAKDFETPSQREMILFCLYLFNNLPHYIPKTTIEFACVLRDTVVKHIELKNNSNKGISYRVRLEGDADFSLGLEGDEREGSIDIDAKKPEMFPIKYTARLSKTMTGRVIFTNKRQEGNVPAAALVFELKSKVTGRRSEATEVIQTRLYEMKQRDLRVENHFNQKADFQVEFIYQKATVDPDKAKKRAVGGSSKKKSPRKEGQQVDDFFQPFASKFMTLTVPRQGAATIPITFLPFTMETHTCYLVLRDDKVGEIQYTLVGEVDLPPPIEIPTAGTFYLDNEIRFFASININNHLMVNARKMHIERLPQSQKAKEQEKEKNLKLAEKSVESTTFEIECLSTYLMLPTTFTVTNKGGKPDDKKIAGSATATKKKNESSFDSKVGEAAGGGGHGPTGSTGAAHAENKLPINLNFKTPTRDHPLRFIFKSQNKLDIRLYEIKVTVLPKPIKAVLEMKCAAGETLNQDIPVKNDTDKDWTIKAQLMTDGLKNGSCFSGGKDFRVPKNSTAGYTIQFKPPWMMTAEARLMLTNTFNGQQYDFDLKGIGEEPVAEGHVILECKARKTKSHLFRVKNETNSKMNYKVETDLYNASGKSTFELKPGATEDYVLDVTPMLGGAYTGSITFTDEQGRYKWWTVEVHTESPKAEKTIDLVTTIRKAIAFDISITNPLDEIVTFEVVMSGEGLIGDNAFTLYPKQTGMYELVFSPLKPMKQTGSLALIHEKLGELWYELNLQSDEPAAVRLTTLKAELGKTEGHEVELENPSGKEVQVRYRLSNPHQFDILPEDIVIPPYDSVIAQIRYMPSDLDIMESSEITFETEEIGKWSYLAFGQGIPPTKFDTQTVSGSLNRDSSSMINFKNPFKDPITVTISLEADDEGKKVFEILLKKTKLTIGGLNVIQIPVSFLPRAINDYYAQVVITMNEKISWRYPLKGVTESYSTSSDFILKTKCRVRYETELKLVLPGNPHVNPDERYTLELTNVPKEYEKILQNPNHKALVFTSVKDTLKNSGDPLVFKAVFQPLKPFRAGVDVTIVKSTGGRWKYKLFLESATPDPDDIITITSPINKTSSISFRLTNYTKHSADFTAGFTADSDSEFTINPKSGLLEPYGKEGTNFIVSFTPIEYGKIKMGRLIIQTEEMYWSYNLKGIFPKYIIPKINSTRIENKLSETVAKKLSSGQVRKNFLVENIKKSSQSPLKKRDRPASRSRSRSKSKSKSPQRDEVKEAVPSMNRMTTPK